MPASRRWCSASPARLITFLLLLAFFNCTHATSPTVPALQAAFQITPSYETVLIPELEQSSPQSQDRTKIFGHPHFSAHQLRVVEPKFCDGVQQYSGYLDISESRHLFFWFFEARHGLQSAPLVLWLNGGPGGSSIACGLIFENGACTLLRGTNTTVSQPYSWNERVNIIYLDEPIGTGFSYASDGSLVTSLKELAADVYAFLQLFMHAFPRYSSLPLHIAAESWGGHYAPEIASLVHHQNLGMQHPPGPFEGQVKLNLASVILANGLTEPFSQFEAIPEYMCGGGPYPPHESTSATCAALRLGNPGCLQAIRLCYRWPESKEVCNAAFAACWPGQMLLALKSTSKNPYDLRKECQGNTDGLCYAEFNEIGAWLNRTATKRELGVDPDFNFAVINETVAEPFYENGQAMLNSAALLPELIEAGIRVLAYAGDTDGVCNYMGIELWMSRLQHSLRPAFQKARSVPWKEPNTRAVVGTARVAGRGAGNFTFVRVYDAGHMAPHDQPMATLDMLTRWIWNMPWT